jgi:prephenate dehydrogenase
MPVQPAPTPNTQHPTPKAPPWDVVTIVGIGMVGGSLGMALRERGLARRVVGVARRTETVERALALGAVDGATTDLLDGVREAELVVLATPVLTMLETTERMAPGLRPGCVVTDVGSTKGMLVERIPRLLSPGAFFVGGHPMAGSERGGVEASQADLFEGATYLITPTPGTPEPVTERVMDLVRALGALPRVVDPVEHDRVAAAISHLPHVAAAAVVHAVARSGESEEALRSFIAGGFKSTTRIAGSPPEMWRDICLTNVDALRHSIQLLQDSIQTFARALDAGDVEAIHAHFASAREARSRLTE